MTKSVPEKYAELLDTMHLKQNIVYLLPFFFLWDLQWLYVDPELKFQETSNNELSYIVLVTYQHSFADPNRFRLTRQTTFGRRHMNSCTETSIHLWMVSTLDHLAA